MISSILTILGGILTVWGNWMTEKSKPRNVEARILEDERKKQDQFREDLDKQNLPEIQRKLSDRD